MPKSLLFFDVNETLLDLSALDPIFDTLLADRSARGRWFAMLLRWSMVMSASGRYENFSVIGRHSLDAIARQYDQSIDDAGHRLLADAIATLPPHADVEDGLQRLQDTGYRLIALTNSAQSTLNTQFSNNGLNRYFEAALSVDHVQCFKPDPRVYNWAAGHMGAEISDCRLIATHDWDVSGAMSAGMQGGYLDRGLGVHPLAITADCSAANLQELARAIIEKEADA